MIIMIMVAIIPIVALRRRWQRTPTYTSSVRLGNQVCGLVRQDLIQVISLLLRWFLVNSGRIAVLVRTFPRSIEILAIDLAYLGCVLTLLGCPTLLFPGLSLTNEINKL